MKPNHRIVQAVCAALVSALTATAAPAALAAQDAGKAQASATASGEVRRVDASAGKVTIKHGEIPGLGLPAMTLVYRADPALLSGIKPGQTVSFTATRKDGAYVITKIQ
jgi:Uncharacterized conserved protein